MSETKLEQIKTETDGRDVLPALLPRLPNQPLLQEFAYDPPGARRIAQELALIEADEWQALNADELVLATEVCR